jgi:hypothetical protein
MAAKTDIKTWKFLKKDVEVFLLEQGMKEILLQEGRINIDGKEVGYGGAFLRLELHDARPSEPVIFYLDGN